MAKLRLLGPARVVAVTGAVLLALIGPAAIATGPLVAGTATLSVAPTSIRFGDQVTASGTLHADAPCATARLVEVQVRPAGTAEWSAASTTTDQSGEFSTPVAPEFSGTLRALVPEALVGDVACAPIVSDEAAVSVTVAATIVTGSAPLAAGACRRVVVTVQPAKAGQVVQVQRQVAAGGWVIAGTATLGSDSSARPQVCLGWASLGPLAIRARWVTQDPLNATGASDALALDVGRAPWMLTIDRLTAGRAVSVSVREAGAYVYRRSDTVMRTPASNEKLLLSMALLDRLDPSFSIVTSAATAAPPDDAGVIHGDIWLLGRGDPGIEPADMAALAQLVADAGVTAIDGSVVGSTGHFARDWFAPGWKSYFPEDVIALPSALTFRGNSIGGVHVSDPEFRAARSLTVKLRALGVEVDGDPAAGAAPEDLTQVAEIRSPSLSALLETLNVDSINFDAEVLGKLLSVQAWGGPGTIAGGGDAIEAFADDRGIDVTAHDSSGLSYLNRVTADGLARLLGAVEDEAWGTALRDSLPGPGEGTLEERLTGVPVEAKTGTLIAISALSGYVYLERTGTWAEFSILSQGMTKTAAVDMEDAIVRTLWLSAQ
jgi:D-alanyl-D-alanine carboxypeptidase